MNRYDAFEIIIFAVGGNLVESSVIHVIQSARIKNDNMLYLWNVFLCFFHENREKNNCFKSNVSTNGMRLPTT